jgi:dipeptidase E
MKLLLTSFGTSVEQDKELEKLLGMKLTEAKVAYIENAYDVYHDEAALQEGREEQRRKGYDVELLDLRGWKNDQQALRQKLASKDLFVLTGGNPFYLRWMMRVSGADEIIRELVEQGKVYVGASASSVVAGPTLRYFDNQDDPNAADEVIWEGLHLTDVVVVPHVDNAEFGAGCREAGEKLKAEGYPTQFITDAQAFLIDGDERRVI